MRSGSDTEDEVCNEVLEAMQLEEQLQAESSTDDVEFVNEYRVVRKAEKRTRQECASDEGASSSAQGGSPQERIKKIKNESGPKIIQDMVLEKDKKKVVGKEITDMRRMHKLTEVGDAVNELCNNHTRRVEKLVELACSDKNISVLQKREVRAVLQQAREIEKGVRQCAALRQEIDLELVEGLKFIREMRKEQQAAGNQVTVERSGRGEARRHTFAEIAKTGTPVERTMSEGVQAAGKWLPKPVNGAGVRENGVSVETPEEEGKWQTVTYAKAPKTDKKKNAKFAMAALAQTGAPKKKTNVATTGMPVKETGHDSGTAQNARLR
ncbi:hypothetical protein KPH14_000785 [Odynerus spinipes]|uniref:Uncharacterized protein n=1 Tax=Odynerus spinipes TaxID=1348599 RepID=A0AAD9REP9_9HYME|nr:hypothetical protein KPH14_000785 [Odynerus spinipes]